jgi:hypothetical protein
MEQAEIDQLAARVNNRIEDLLVLAQRSWSGYRGTKEFALYLQDEIKDGLGSLIRVDGFRFKEYNRDYGDIIESLNQIRHTLPSIVDVQKERGFHSQDDAALFSKLEGYVECDKGSEEEVLVGTV